MKIMKKMSAVCLVAVMVLTAILPTGLLVSASDNKNISGKINAGDYAIAMILNEEKTSGEVALKLTPNEDIKILAIVLPDGTKVTNMNDTIMYSANVNGLISFQVNYVNVLQEGSLVENLTETIDYSVSGIEIPEIEAMKGTEEKQNTEVISNVAEKSTRNINTVTLDLADGKILIDADGYRRSVKGILGAKVPFVGSYTIIGRYDLTLYPSWDADVVSVIGGTEANPIDITLKDATIDVTDENNVISMASAFKIGDPLSVEKAAHVSLTLDGNNVLRGSGSGAGIELLSSSEQFKTRSTLVIGGSGTLEATGGIGGAGIGGGRTSISGIDYKITINSGVINATGGFYGAGIGGGQATNGGEIIINGGTIKATGGENAAGIGGGTSIGGGAYDGIRDMNIEINGGTITATGGRFGAGIGTARYDALSSLAGIQEYYMSINIKGTADVTATGGTSSAGIGQGFFFNQDTSNPTQKSSWIVDSINISGGNVKAQGSGSSAGIGTSQSASIVKNINISGGAVDAIGTYLGAGIGSGYNGIFEKINISGGTVNAISGNYASGIGTGNLGVGGDIVIEGGVVNAKSTQMNITQSGQGSGIGSGYRSSIDSLTIGAKADVTATASPFASGIGRSYYAEATPDKVFPIVIEQGAKVTAYALGDTYSDLLKVGDVLPDALYMSAIDQGCIAHAKSNIAANIMMGDFKVAPNADADQEVVISNLQAPNQEKRIVLPAEYASFATTVPSGLYRAKVNDEVYAGSLMKRSEDTLVVNMGGDKEQLLAYWMLQPVVLSEYSVDFKFTSNTNPEGINVPTTITVEDGNAIIEPVSLAIDGWVFDGWYSDETCTQKFDFTTVITTNMTLYGNWTINKYIVNFDSNGGTTVNPTTDVEHGATITAPTSPTKVGYMFNGWYSDSALTKSWDFTNKVLNNTTLYANWKKVEAVVDVYKASFEFNGGSFRGEENPEFTVSILSDSSRLITVYPYDTFVTKTGHTFTGWYSDAACTKRWDFAKDTVTGDIKLYAGWEKVVEPVVDVYKASFEFNGGSFKGEENPEFTVSILSDSSRLITVYPYDTFVTKTGHTFTGWYSDVACTKKWDFAKDTVTGDIKLYAGWEKVAEVETPIKPEDSNNSSKPSTPENKEESPKTGDTTSLNVLIMLSSISAGFILIYGIKRRKKQH